ncbi:MAG: RNA degradosome polyphosphate kinase, partial [Isosphaeraceae bacterium]
MAEDPARPLAERIRFLAILSDSLDDFFQVRVAGLHEQLMSPMPVVSPDGMTPEDQLESIGRRVRELIERQSTVFHEQVVPGLVGAGVTIVRAADLPQVDRDQLSEVFQERIFPVLTPLAVDPAHP